MSSATEDFLRSVSRHTMTAIKDEGLHRQLWFGRPGTSCMHFQIITWPGYLCYTGDMGTYVFKRLDDMLQFFRRETGERKYRIDFRYWAEKVEAADKCDGIKEFSQEKFNRNVKNYVLEWVRDNRESTTREQRRELWDAVMDEVIECEGDQGGNRQQAAAHDFRHQVSPTRRFEFRDFWEINCEVYTHRFVWACHALAWAIAVYDASKTESRAMVAA